MIEGSVYVVEVILSNIVLFYYIVNVHFAIVALGH